MGILLSRLLAALAALAACVVAITAPAEAARGPVPAAKALRLYLPRMSGEIKRYHAAIERGARAFESGITPSVELARMRASRDEFKRLATRIERVRPPSGLRKAHASLVTAVKMVSGAFAKFVSVRERYARDNQIGPVIDGNTQANKQLKRAEGYQDRWGNTVRASARRAKVPIPTWLKNFRS